VQQEYEGLIAVYDSDGHRLHRRPPTGGVDGAVWIDLYRPDPDAVAAIAALGVDVPTLADMEEIEISNRLYREGGYDYMTVVLPGQTETAMPTAGPVCLILGQGRLVTVRHHKPRPFETYPDRADKGLSGCNAAEDVFLGLFEDIVGRLADILELSGKTLDAMSTEIFAADDRPGKPQALARVLEKVGREGDGLGRVRLSLLTLGRALGFHVQSVEGNATLRSHIDALQKDLQSLEVHADFLSNRVALASDATIGMINLVQSSTVRIVSVVAVLFLPPTLIASIYGMNFTLMPELAEPWGYPAALVLMLASAAGTYLFFRWKNWL
jgi:magnesium transporter